MRGANTMAQGFLVWILSIGLAHAATHVPDKTIHNLESAIQAEANAANRYELFSRKAQTEGYPQVARLFRAASQAEAIHRKNHQAALLARGGPMMDVQLATVKLGSTRQNLEIPIKGEAEERDVIYPRLIRQAKADHAEQAVRSFIYARDTEAEHEKLFKRALAELGHNPPEDYYVNKISGYTVAVPQGHEFAKAKTGKYIRVG